MNKKNCIHEKYCTRRNSAWCYAGCIFRDLRQPIIKRLTDIDIRQDKTIKRLVGILTSK